MELLAKKKLFDPLASDDNIRIIKGETTNLLNLENIKYQWAHDIFDTIYSNNWLPHKVSLLNDKQNFKDLTPEEQKAYKTLISFLMFLDSIQTNNLPNIAEYITASDVVYVLSRQTFDEAIHSKSYGWINSSIFSHSEAMEIAYEFKTNNDLLVRNNFITSKYQDFVDNPTEKKLLSAIVANYLLEGLYFYNGFQFFHNLANRGLMIGTDTQIKYIQRDEIQHCNIFKNILLEIQKENPDLWEENKEMIYSLFKEAVDWEIRFSKATIGNNILGITENSITEYAHYLANLRLKHIKLEQIFPKVDNPYKHLDRVAGVESEISNRSNNFETTSISYKNPSLMNGFDEL